MLEGERLVRVVAKVAAYALAAGALLGTGAALSYHYQLTVGIDRRTGGAVAAGSYVPTYRVEPGDRLVMAYVGASTCPWSNRPELPQAVERIKTRLAARARESGLGFKAEGIALEWSTAQGINHLEEFGLFDEVSAGYNWGNSFALNHLWADPSSVPATPLVIVFRRSFVAPLGEDDEMLYAERDRRNLHVARGLAEILEWAEADGPPLDEGLLQGS